MPGASTTHIEGTLNSTPETAFDVDLYAAACVPRPQDYLQGDTYLGSVPVTTDGFGNADFATDVPYVRQEISLLSAFPKFPKIVVPAATAAKGPRIFELRTYESPTERAHRAKVKMFSEMGEIEIFHRAGLTPVFFSRTVAGPKMPSLTYMLVHENMAARDKNWSAFGSDPDWRKLAATPGYTDPEIVSNITVVYLRPAAYSQI